MGRHKVVAAIRRAQESAKALKTTANISSDPTAASQVDNILDCCFFVLSILTQLESSRRSNKSREEVFKRYRDDSPTLIFDDGYSWTKNGEKSISKSPHKRSYYRCYYGKYNNCEAKKRVQKIQDDPPVFRTIYVGEHTCQNVVISGPVEDSNMIQFDSHDRAMTDRQESVGRAVNQEEKEEEVKLEQFLGFDFPSLTEEEMKFFDNIFV